MTKLDQFEIKAVKRSAKVDPITKRRNKLVERLDEQMSALEARKQGERYTVPIERWRVNNEGQNVRLTLQRKVREWFFERDGGWYVQCKYGAKPLQITDRGNAIFVEKLDDVEEALKALRVAAGSGELDSAIAELLTDRTTAGLPKKGARAKS